MKRILIAGLVGGIIIFAVGAAMHMSPLGMIGLDTIPNDEVLRTALKDNLPHNGLYFVPGPDPAKPDDMEAWEARMTTGPSALIVYQTVGTNMTPRQLVTELVADILAALIAAVIAAMLIGAYGKRVAAITLLQVFAWALLTVSYWNWYHFPAAFVLTELFMEIVGMALAALAIAKIVPPPARA